MVHSTRTGGDSACTGGDRACIQRRTGGDRALACGAHGDRAWFSRRVPAGTDVPTGTEHVFGRTDGTGRPDGDSMSRRGQSMYSGGAHGDVASAVADQRPQGQSMVHSTGTSRRGQGRPDGGHPDGDRDIPTGTEHVFGRTAPTGTVHVFGRTDGTGGDVPTGTEHVFRTRKGTEQATDGAHGKERLASRRQCTNRDTAGRSLDGDRAPSVAAQRACGGRSQGRTT